MQDNGIFWEKTVRLLCLYAILKSQKNTGNTMNLSNILNTGKFFVIFSCKLFSQLL